MNLTNELIIAAAVVGSIALQLGSRRADLRRFILPVVVVAVVCYRYLNGIPTDGPDLTFIGAGVLIGVVSGLAAAGLMRVHRSPSGEVMLTAGIAYLGLWVALFGSRLAFAWTVTNIPDVTRQIGIFSYQHGITSAAAWTAFFVLQAVAMVAVRTLVVGARVLAARRPATAS